MDAVSASDLQPQGDAERRIVAALSGSGLIESLDVGVGAVVFLYKKADAHGGATSIHGLCDQPLAIVDLLCMEYGSAGVRQRRHVAHGYLHLAVKTSQAEESAAPVARRLSNGRVLPFTR
jgi:hypothetical protein